MVFASLVVSVVSPGEKSSSCQGHDDWSRPQAKARGTLEKQEQEGAAPPLGSGTFPLLACSSPTHCRGKTHLLRLKVLTPQQLNGSATGLRPQALW